MGGKMIIKIAKNRRISIPATICTLLEISEGTCLEAYLDYSGKVPKIVLQKQSVPDKPLGNEQ